MDYPDILAKLSSTNESDAEFEFSIAKALSLPIDFLVSFVRNRRETELLLKVSKSAMRLDSCTKAYELMALRAQGLQEAWNASWISQESYVVPIISIIGVEMSGVNHGRSILLEKIQKEIGNLEELGKQLSHFIEVNCSLVEELRMEGIDRLAVNKLLLVEVEKEIGRRVTRICTNDSVLDLSSMRQFLFDLIQNPPPIGIVLDADNPSRFLNSELEERVAKNTVTSSRCSQHVSSKREAASEILISKSGSTSPLLRNGMPQHLKETLDFPVTLSKERFPATLLVEAPCEKGDIMLDVRNQSSSASEERLPKHVGNGPNDLMQAAGRDNLRKYENKQHCDIDGSKVNSMPMDTRKRLDHQGSKVLCDTEKTNVNFLEAENPGPGEVSGFSRLTFNHARGKHDSSEARTTAVLPAKFSDHNLSDGSNGKCLCPKVQVNNCNDQNFHIIKPESKHGSKKRPAELEPSLGEDVHMRGRSPKRILLKASSQSGKSAAFMRQDSLNQRVSEYNGRRKHSSEINNDQAITISNSGSEKRAEVDLPDDSVSSKNGTSSVPCSCGQQIFDALTDSLSASQQNPLTQGRCEDCGCPLSQSFDQHNKDTIDGNASVDLDYQKALVEPSSLVPGYPILATQ